jgi:ring-1,2-phenylacetyl-CoA epoxidase subunit PaaE
MPPDGRFVLRREEEQGDTYVFFAAGSGITPVISLIKTILETIPGRQIILFYGNRSTDSIIFKDELDALKNRYLSRFELHHILSQEKQEVPLFNGRIDEEKCRTFAKSFFRIPSVRRFFICGPELMIFALRDCLIALGVKQKDIAIELFSSPDTKRAQLRSQPIQREFDTAKECHVTVRLDGDTTEFSLAYGGSSILDAAMAAGVDVPFSCKGGVCCTCKAMLLDGEVAMDVVYGLEPDEIEDGFILTCQSHPRSESVLVDYDIR